MTDKEIIQALRCEDEEETAMRPIDANAVYNKALDNHQNGIVICSEEHGMYCPTENDFCSYGERRDDDVSD